MCRWSLIPMLLTALLFLARCLNAATDESELHRLQGVWDIDQVVDDGKSVPQEKIKGFKLVFDKQKLTWVTPDGKKEHECRVRLDDQPAPHTMDLVGLRGADMGETTPAIYELKDDSLRICLPSLLLHGAKQRPISFKVEQDSHLVLFTLKRFKGVLAADTLAALATEPQPEQEAAIAAIEKLGGSVKRDVNAAGEPAIEADLIGKFNVAEADLEHLKKLPHLRKLSVWCHTDAGLEYIKGLVELQELIFQGPANDSSLRNLEGLTHLRTLAIPGRFSDRALSHLKSLTELQKLNLNGINVTGTGLKYLAGLPKLTKLDLTHARIADHGLEPLSEMHQLADLNLQHSTVIDSDLGFLRALPQLQVLNLQGTKIGDAGLENLASLKQLRKLDLCFCEFITDSGMKYLEGLTDLQDLNLGYTMHISEAGIMHIRKALPNCKIESRSTIRLPVFPKGLKVSPPGRKRDAER